MKCRLCLIEDKMRAYLKLISFNLLLSKVSTQNFSQALRRNHPEMPAVRKCLSELVVKSNQQLHSATTDMLL